MKTTDEQLKQTADTIRCLCADMIDKANSGHPGAALGMADMATLLWLRYLNLDVKDLSWAGRDRLVFSGGHASSLVYALFHLAGVGGLTMDELKNFRQFGGRCAGHPERGLMPGVDVTTGPLGQGIAMGVGLALAAKKRATGNRTFVFCGDGDMEEGISHEACSWAGANKLDDLILIYDSNGITIEGSTDLAMADDTKRRFESYGWKVLKCNGHDFADIDKAFRKAMKVKGQPVLVIATTTIGFGAPTKGGNESCHGAPLGAEETKALKVALGRDPEASFAVGAETYELFRQRAAVCRRIANKWRRNFKGETQPKWTTEELVAALPKFTPGESVATRSANEKVMTAIAPIATELVGGSADLGPSNKTIIKGIDFIKPGDFSGRNMHYGIRELAMTAIANGITAFGGLRGYGATFFVFSDYCRPAIRLAAIMEMPSIFVFSHDSFYVGEDGPTHEPIEHLAAMRTMINVLTFRPCDANETAYAWVEAMNNLKGPTCILTTRQNVPVLEGTSYEGVKRGAYVIYEGGYRNETVAQEGTKERTVLFIASGSEVALAIEAAKMLEKDGKLVRVVSMPSQERFLKQDMYYRDSVIPPEMKKRVVVEAASRFGWDRFRLDFATTRFVTIDHYGASAPYKVLAKEFGFTAENVYKTAKEIA